ncbi:MAG: protein translocase subunit SecD [Candidatus Bipolaricaulia bacterium]
MGWERENWIKLGIIVAVVVVALYFLYPIDESIRLGLDLQGGVRLLLEAQVVGANVDQRREILDRVVTILNNRVDQFGLTEPTITRAGTDRVLVELPGTENPEEARRLIGRTALLEFKRVVRVGGLGEELIPEQLGQQVLRDRDGNVYLVDEEPVLTGAALSDARVRIDQQSPDPIYIALTFNRDGAEQFTRAINRLQVNEQLAIVLDGVIQSAPFISQGIKDAARSGRVDQARIEGRYTVEEGRSLAIVLRAGALPVDVTILQEESVGPTLGADSVRRGVISITAGFILILIYMVIRYRWLGLVANLALLLNMLIIFGALAGFRATLTLPGIAGVILTIGISVDANVIIFERIKEERRAGKSPRASIRGGFQKSLSAVLDANITTLAAASILLLLGTGPIRGFAITLGIGILGSLFAALFVTRFILITTGLTPQLPAKVTEQKG